MRAEVKRKMNAVIAAIMAAIFAFSLSSVPTSALAANGDNTNTNDSGITISGVDFMQPSATSLEVLRVNGLGEDKEIYISLLENGTALSNPQKFTPKDSVGKGGDNIAQIVSLELGKNALQLIDSKNPAKYTIEVRTTGYEGAEPIKTLTIYPVYALIEDLDGKMDKKLIGIRTMEQPVNSNIGVSQTYYTQESGQDAPTSYSLVKPAGNTDNTFNDVDDAFYVTYKQNDAAAVTGTINYVCDGVVVKTETVTGVNSEKPTFANILNTFAVRNSSGTTSNYRVISNLSGTQVPFSTNPDTFCTSYTVQVVELKGKVTQEVTIKYVADSADGEVLWTDQLSVFGDGYFYTIPNTFSMSKIKSEDPSSSDGVQFYQLDSVLVDGIPVEGEGIANPADAGSVIALVPPENASGEQTITAIYNTNMFKARMTLQIIDGSTGNVLKTETFDIEKDKPGVDYKLENLEENGKTYVPWEGNLENVTYSWEDLAAGKELLQRVYYVPEGWTPGETKNVTVQYKNIANGQVIRSDVYELTPENNYLTVVGDERYNYDGVEFVRLPGQESGIRHAYFSPNNVYTIWYRDVNDTQNAGTTIGAFQNPNGDAVGGITAVGGETPGITGGDGAIIINDDDNPLANLDGVDTTTERTLEDNENPLFSGNGLLQNGIAVASIAIGALALIGLLMYFLIRRRKKANDEQEA